MDPIREGLNSLPSEVHLHILKSVYFVRKFAEFKTPFILKAKEIFDSYQNASLTHRGLSLEVQAKKIWGDVSIYPIFGNPSFGPPCVKRNYEGTRASEKYFVNKNYFENLTFFNKLELSRNCTLFERNTRYAIAYVEDVVNSKELTDIGKETLLTAFPNFVEMANELPWPEIRYPCRILLK